MNLFMLLGGIALLVLVIGGGYALMKRRKAAKSPLGKAQAAQQDTLERVQESQDEALSQQQEQQSAQLQAAQELLQAQQQQQQAALQAQQRQQQEMLRQQQEAAKKAAEAIPAVVEATDGSLDSAIRNGTWVVMYYSPNCGYCVRTKPTIQQLGEQLRRARLTGQTGVTYVAQLDCTKNPRACRKAQVRGYPHIVKYTNGSEVDVYQGDRTLASLAQFAQ